MREEPVIHAQAGDARSESNPSLLAFLANWGLGLSGLWQCLPDGLRWPSERQLLAWIPAQAERPRSVGRRTPH